MEIQSVVWRDLKSSEQIKIFNGKMLLELEEYLGNDDFHIIGVMNDGVEKIVINLTGYREHLENNLGVGYSSYYDEDQEMRIYFADKEDLDKVFTAVKSIFQLHGFNVHQVKSTCIDLEDFSVNIRVEVLVMPKCPVCKQNDLLEEGANALSRKDNETEICSDCGRKEAMEELAAYEKELQDL
jgi:hypothetical protein